jgi:hypothetical protein
MSALDITPINAAAVTPNDTVSQSGVALYVGGVGNVTLVTEGGDTVLFTAVPAGTVLNIRFIRINSTGTTATLMVRMGYAAFLPTNTVAPSVSGLTAVGSVLTCTNGTWLGNPTITFAFQWLKAGVAIAGAVVSTYTSVAGDVGAAISCRVTATNNAASVSVNSSNSITVT